MIYLVFEREIDCDRKVLSAHRTALGAIMAARTIAMEKGLKKAEGDDATDMWRDDSTLIYVQSMTVLD